ncbi:MAG: twin-arginine translocation signal domain-containing protein [Nitrosomonas sp.]|nr:twin-arginine translocation signal domain-containing protein [Nitrosomonas sp.]
MSMNRRQFLSMTGATALVAVCSPTALSEQSPAQHAWPGASATLKAMQNLKQQKKTNAWLSHQHGNSGRRVFCLAQ